MGTLPVLKLREVWRILEILGFALARIVRKTVEELGNPADEHLRTGVACQIPRFFL